METQSDYKELFELLNANAVSYVIVGAYALAFHGVPRYTGDVDILVEPTAENAARVADAAGSRVAGQYGEVPIWYLGRDALVKNKKATGRLQDLADIEALAKLPS